ncbi:VWA domain-containing protein [Kangiella koreensis]|uniref:TPR repeat-containing protein n=1 Tax=Kangiella koreensis (strain DSM 16069 / JCM 12317 / KCTC 12182 / SW-125) TaxID=523791 RepID=C7R6G6_KANKD|nr:VWA domain-containing protein [Kangiella koreensis]ACV27394.1 TPR repeat-containing protein [Kangiella koreensis DSM 16069]
MFDFLPDIHLLHFVRPWAWLLLIPVFIFWWLYRTRGQQASGWAKLIDQHLLSWLMPKSQLGKSIQWQKNLLLAFWILAVAALSGPSWKKLPQPVFSNLASRVLVLDLSASMDSPDVKPSRLARAKFKLTDILKAIKDGQTGFVVYAGDGFVLSPLTTDTDTIDNMVGVLATNLMPLVGSQPSKGIEKAIELLDNGAAGEGDIIWITDGASDRELSNIESLMSKTPYNLNILAIGTEQGAPIPMPNGSGFIKDSKGNIVIPKLNYDELASLADDIGATLTPMTAGNDDIDLLLEREQLTIDEKLEKQDIMADSWEDAGFWLLFLVLPILLLGFKHRSMFAVIVIMSFSLTISPDVQANPLEKMFLNKDQQAKKLLNKEQYDEAYKTFEDPQWKAVAAYRNEEYKTAQDFFEKGEQLKPADQHYNKANAQALAGDLEAAIESYNQALNLDAHHEDAQHNKQIVEDLLKQQQEQEQEQNQQKDEPSESEQEQNDQQQEQQQNENSQNDESSEQQQESSEQQQQEPELTEEELQQQFKEEEKDQELEQWLKRLPDDPGGLLRRKMYQEYRKRGHRQHVYETW